MRYSIYVGAALAILCVAPTSADWLVLKSGQRAETKGPWQVKGKLVVFTQPDGRLSSLRLDDVALDESAAATARARDSSPAVTAAPEVPKRKAVLTLTDKDVAHVNDTGESTPAVKPADATTTDPVSQGLVKVGGWEKIRTPDGLGTEIHGSVINPGKNTATDVKVVIKAYGAEGKLLVTADAVMEKTVITPGDSTTFSAVLPGVSSLSTALFEVQSRGLVTAPPAPIPPST